MPDAQPARAGAGPGGAAGASWSTCSRARVREVELSAASVREAIDALDARWPGMRDRVCDSRPAIRRHINVFVDGDKATLDTPLAPGTEVIIMTAISGG